MGGNAAMEAMGLMWGNWGKVVQGGQWGHLGQLGQRGHGGRGHGGRGRGGWTRHGAVDGAVGKIGTAPFISTCAEGVNAKCTIKRKACVA